MQQPSRSDRLEIIDNFVVVTVVTVLCIRGFLLATDFPQLGSDGLHIAHALWGGLALTIALLVSLLSSRPNKPLLAIIGGIGFGFFIDEIGKFVTSNNNYFFTGSFYIMYMTLILLWFISRLIIVRKEQRPFFINASWPKHHIDKYFVVFWAILQVVGSLPISFYFVIRHNTHPFLDIVTCTIILMYAIAVALSLLLVARGAPDRGARMLQRSILFAIIFLLPTLYFEFAIVASVGAITAILVMINLSEVSIGKVLWLQRER